MSLNYLSNSETAKNIINNLAGAASTEFIVNIKSSNDPDAGTFSYGVTSPSNESSIPYNPKSALRDAINGAEQMPALTLLHELDHANGSLELYRTSNDSNKTPRNVWEANSDRHDPASTYELDNKEEERVITGNETKTIKELKQHEANVKRLNPSYKSKTGLNVRPSHWGNSFISKGPLTIEKQE